MRACRCDRCGKYMVITAREYFSLPRRTPWKFGHKHHLCPECVDEFRDWYDEKRPAPKIDGGR